jgi:hypothetical protein
MSRIKEKTCSSIFIHNWYIIVKYFIPFFWQGKLKVSGQLEDTTTDIQIFIEYFNFSPWNVKITIGANETKIEYHIGDMLSIFSWISCKGNYMSFYMDIEIHYNDDYDEESW